jgi:hypothetical protein
LSDDKKVEGDPYKAEKRKLSREKWETKRERGRNHEMSERRNSKAFGFVGQQFARQQTVSRLILSK